MYDLPNKSNVKECVISEEVISGENAPVLVYGGESEEPAEVGA